MRAILLALFWLFTICLPLQVGSADQAWAAQSPAVAYLSGGAAQTQVAGAANRAAGAETAMNTTAPGSSATESGSKRVITVGMFLAVIAATIGIVIWAGKKTQTASDFYAAGGGITGMQNGWAIAGDFLSASTFLGITGLVTVFGLDGVIYTIGPLISFITILLVVAEPLRNVGKYTMGDILALRGSAKEVRAAAAVSTVTISMFYLLAQMVGAGKLMQLLLGIPYRASIVGIGILITFYVVIGGMKAATWVQIVKAALLFASGVGLALTVLAKAGMNPVNLIDSVASSQAVQEHVRMLLKHPLILPDFDYGQRFLEPGLFLKDPLDLISLGVGTILGAAGLPHIMMRFFTVPNGKEARKSVLIAMIIIGVFLLLTTVIGFGADLYVTPQTVLSSDKGGNLASLLLAQFVGGGAGSLGGELLFAFVCAVAFATILAVVSGLVLASSAAIAHDLYVNVIKKGKADQQLQVRVARGASLAVGLVTTVLGVAAENMNVAHLAVLAFAVAASCNFPVIILSLFWRRFNTSGILCGIFVGIVSCLALVLVSPNMTYPKKIAADARKVVETLNKKQAGGGALTENEQKTLAKSQSDYQKNKDGKSLLGLDAPLFKLRNPGIVSVPLGFMAAFLGCLLFRDRRAEEDFDELYVRQNTGVGIAEAAKH